MMDKFLEKFFPPGYDGDKEIKWLTGIYLTAIIFSFQFFFSYYEAYNDLFYYDWQYYEETGKKSIIPGTVIVPFGEILGNSFLFFIVLVLVLVIAGVQHYLYYTKGSNSLYLVRRLPDKNFVQRTCFAGMVLELGIVFVTIGVLLAVYYGVYLLVTPTVCLP